MKLENQQDWEANSLENLLCLAKSVGYDLVRYSHGRSIGATFQTSEGFGYVAFAESGPQNLSLNLWRCMGKDTVLPTREDAEALLFSVMKACEHGAD